MELTMLGTGNALVTECYNTCYVFEENDKYFLVDGGGGNEILKRLKYNNIDYRKIHDIMITHKHTGNMREKLISMVMTRSLHYFVI